LGNPGREHSQTRHNVGFMVADRLAERWDFPRAKARFRGLVAEGKAPGGELPGEGMSGGGAPAGDLQGDVSTKMGAPHAHARVRAALLWPQTYMNEAGRSVGPARGSFKLPLERVLVVHDEIDLPFGDVRTRLGGGLAGHNGLKSIKRELGGPDFMRIRVGVGRPKSTDPEIVSAYVLGRFREPADEVGDLIDQACQAVERVVLGME
jgi:PTH1 family peptidyl-tRNA hydrolase